MLRRERKLRSENLKFPSVKSCLGDILLLLSFLVRSPKDGDLLGVKWGMIVPVSNIIFPDENCGARCGYSKEWDKI